MALFFDQDWFSRELARAGQSHDALAAAAGLTLEELAAVWKDQMEVTTDMITGFSQVLGVDAHEIASRCGVGSSTDPLPDSGEVTMAAFKSALDRIARLEAEVTLLGNEIVELKKGRSGAGG